jgi:hypothetical protein
MTRSLAQDTPPEFPLPKELLQNTQHDHSVDDIDPAPHPRPWRHIFPPNHIMISIFDDLHHAITINQNSATNQQWRTITFLNHQIYPILHRLFIARTEVSPNDRWSIIQEVSRLGIVLFLGEIRRQCGAVASSTKIYIGKLKLLLDGAADIEWNSEDLVLLLWIVFFGVLESWGLDDGEWSLGCLRDVMRRMELRSWEEVVESVRGFLWVDEIFDARAETVRGVIQA